jgi:RNA polymerase sigma-70 factor (sigma-E family)
MRVTVHLWEAGGSAGTAEPKGTAMSSPRTWDADEAVTSLYAAHYRSLVRLSALLLRDPGEAEEVVQDAFVAMHGRWKRLREADKAVAYLRQTVLNRSRSALRRRAVREKHAPAPPAYAPSAEHQALLTEQHHAIVAALRTLPDRQREAIVLRYYADLPEADTALAMGVSRGAVKSHTSRGMAALRRHIENVEKQTW